MEETPKDASLLNLFGVMWNKLGDYERCVCVELGDERERDRFKRGRLERKKRVSE